LLQLLLCMMLMLLRSDCDSIQLRSDAYWYLRNCRGQDRTLSIPALLFNLKSCCFSSVFLLLDALFRGRGLLSIFLKFFCSVLQENSKTKHPQLLYEAKLYNILQGGSMFFLYWFKRFDLIFIVSMVHGSEGKVLLWGR